MTIFVILTCGLLTCALFFMPKQGFNIFGWDVKFLHHSDVFDKEEKVIAEIDDLIEVDTTLALDPQIKHDYKGKGNKGAPSGSDFNEESKTTIHFSETGIVNLYTFFTNLEAAASPGKKMHIMHYGDSQLEGDRMTAFIRERVQNQFGGHGPGLISAFNTYSTNTYRQSLSPNFVRYAAFGGDNQLKKRNYGILASAARFTPEITDSTALANAKTIQEGWIEIEPNGSAYARAKIYNNAKMYYTGCLKPCGLKVYQNGNLIHEDSLKVDGKLHSVKLSFPGNPGKLKYVFSSTVSPTICGFNLEGDVGVQMDNVAMRGSSGTIFGSLEGNAASAMYNDINAKMIIMQFGGNSVPFFKDSAGVRGFANSFKSQIKVMKNYNPGAVVVVIGPSDMSQFVDGEYETYKYLPYCVEMMKKAALEVGAGYWDLYNAMGGINSMEAWVNKGLAGKDYIHFSPKGASIASQLFYNALMSEYNKWKSGVQ